MGARSRCWPSFASSSVAWAVGGRAARPALPSVRAGREAAAGPPRNGGEGGGGRGGGGGPPVAVGRPARRRVVGRPARAGAVGRRAVERLAPAPWGVAPARWASAAAP